MNELVLASDADFAAIERHCRQGRLILFRRCLPPGCAPTLADVAIESDARGGTRLFVAPGTTYRGEEPMLTNLFRNGLLQFPSFDALKEFLRQVVAGTFALPSPTMRTALTPVTAPSPRQPAHERLTDLDAVTRALDRPSACQKVLRPDELARLLREKVIGQDIAIDTLAAVAARHGARSQPRRPASVLMLGPTGVGKTKAASLLAASLGQLGAPHGFLRLDMNEYAEAHRVSQMLGSPQGYVGYGEGAQLTSQLAQHPATVVLFDEIEKAHPDILRALMNAIDAGRLSSPTAIAGQREIDCRQALFLFTSNLGVDTLLATVEVAEAGGQPADMDTLCRRHLTREGIAPELAGRIGAFCLFRPLCETDRARILVQAVETIAAEYEVEVEFIHPDVVVHLVRETAGDFGARPGEFLVDRIFGETFAEARQQGWRKLRLDGLPPGHA